MPLLDRRKTAVILIVIGLIALAFGLWILVSMFLPPQTQTANTPAAGTQLPVTPRVTAPKTLAAPVIVQGTSTADANAHGTDLLEAANLASDAVSRMGSGTSQDGFMGYDDVLSFGTDNFRTTVQAEQQSMRKLHPAIGATYGVTTRAVSTKVLDGKNGAVKIVIQVKTQRAEDAGDRSRVTNITYWENVVTLLRQANGKYLVDEIASKQVNQ